MPLGSRNITMDLCSRQISFDEAEEIKITRGYKSPTDERLPIDRDTINSIINARMCEILQNAKYQIEESGERVGHIIFTGGGAKLKNLSLLFDEHLPNFRCEIIPEPQFTLDSSSGVDLEVLTTALYGLLKLGKENCCEENKPVVHTPPVEQTIFTDIPEEEEENTITVEKATPKKDKSITTKQDKKKEKKEDSWLTGLFGKIKDTTGKFVDQVTESDKDDYDYDN